MLSDPRRPRFRFSLRTLLVVVTLLGAALGWAGWQWRIVQERVAAATWIAENDGQFGEYTGEPLPWIRRILGDQPFAYEIILADEPTEARKEELRRIFPECKIGWLVWINDNTATYRSLPRP